MDDARGALKVESFSCHVRHDQVPWTLSVSTVSERAKDCIPREACGSDAGSLPRAPGQTDSGQSLADVVQGVPAYGEDQRW